MDSSLARTLGYSRNWNIWVYGPISENYLGYFEHIKKGDWAHFVSECDISSRDFSVSRLFSIFWEYRSRSRKFWSRKKVSVSVSKIFSLEKKSRYRSRKYLVSKKSLGIGLENFGLKKSLGIGLENFGLKKSLSNDLKKFVLENFGLQKLWTW